MDTAKKEVKDTKESSTKERKRRRTLKTEKPDPIAATDLKKSRPAPASGDNRAVAAFYFEEQEVDNRSPENDLLIHKAVSDELRNVMNEISEIKADEKPDEARLQELRIHGMLQFVTLRKLNRMAHFRCKKSRDKTSDYKQNIDQQNLRIQNLLYEALHLEKEINKCLQFKSKDEDINLVTEAEFYKKAPSSISRPDITKEDSHQRTLARLEWELEQRKRLSEQLSEAQGNKDTIVDDTKERKEFLDSLQPKLNQILQMTKPVQEHLDMPFDEIREQQMTAMYLPQPLYVLYMQASAYKEACDKFMTVNIQGDLDVAKSMESTSVELDDDSDSENEDQEKPKEKRRRRNTSSDKMMEKKLKILKKHPLSVQIIVKCKDGGSLELSFWYLVVLQIVTVGVKLTPGGSSTQSAICAGDLLSADSLLSCLYPDDVGSDTPNKSNNYALQRIGLPEFGHCINEVGRPYHWVQWLCGLQFLNVTDKLGRPQLSISQGHMEGTMKRLRRRVKARMSLQAQLAALERGQVPVMTEYAHLTPSKITSRLSSWKRSTFEDFSILPYAQSIVDEGLATETDLYFIGTVERGSAKLTAHIVINQDYPNVSPLACLNLQWKSEKNRLNDENIRTIEAELNIYQSELGKGKSHDQLLTNQLQRLMMCLDVYVESEADTTNLEGPAEFSREKIFPRTSRGPTRVKPFRYNPHMGFFSHR